MQGGRVEGDGFGLEIRMFEMLIDLVASIWRADSDIRDNSILGESRMEKHDRRIIGWICGLVIILLIIGGMLFWRYMGAK